MYCRWVNIVPTKRKQLPRRKRKKKGRAKRAYEAKYRLRHTSKLTPKLIKEACELIKEGLPLDSVWAYLGITKMTGLDWKEKGEKFLIELSSERGPEFPEDELEAHFMLEIARARASLELDLIRELKDKKAHARWVRNMTILERRFRQSWSRSETLHVDQEQMAPDEAYL